VNFAIALSKKGLRVLIIDADFGLSNVDVVMGVTPKYNLTWVINNNGDIKDVITDGPNGVRFISGGSGVYDLLNLTPAQISTLIDKLFKIEDLADVIIFDTGAGISNNILRLIESSHEVIVVTTPEPTSIMDAYALLKSIGAGNKQARIRLVMNKAESMDDAEKSLTTFSGVVLQYLKLKLETLGYVLNDPIVGKSVRLQVPFVISSPRSAPARNIDGIAWRFLDVMPTETGLTFKTFMNKFLGR
jgi:flagellar biosynthesis protein FlhG